jgi:hypothetical protein
MSDNEDALSSTLVTDGGGEAKVTSDFNKIELHRTTLIVVIITSAAVAL